MARKIKFALEMANGVTVRSNLEELRENFDVDKAVGHFLSGKLVEWLKDRYYEEEAEKISELDKDAPDFRQKLCNTLGVEYNGGDEETDVEFLTRLNEKKNFLRQKSDDKSVVDNADKTALTQEDLSDLLDADEPIIYLCGERFNVPIRVENKKYVGILGRPKITIKVNSQNELDAKNIRFENCALPFAVETEITTEKSATEILSGRHTPYIPKEKIQKLLKDAFIFYESDAMKFNFEKVWDFTFAKDEQTAKMQKNIVMKSLLNSEYSEEEIIYVKLFGKDRENLPGFDRGWALTVDSICHFYTDEKTQELVNEKIEYKNVKSFSRITRDISVTSDIMRMLFGEPPSCYLKITTKDEQDHNFLVCICTIRMLMIESKVLKNFCNL